MGEMKRIVNSEEKLKFQAEMNCQEIEAMLEAVSSGDVDIMTSLITISNDIRILIMIYLDSIQKSQDLRKFKQYITELSEELDPLCKAMEELMYKTTLTADDKEMIDEISKRLLKSLESIKSI